jgi:NTE family protein
MQAQALSSTSQNAKMNQNPATNPGVGDPGPARIGLCLSGGGFRAMLFHAGAILRLAETGLLNRVDVISSVSGGSITASLLAVYWERLMNLPQANIANAYRVCVIDTLRNYAAKPLDVQSMLWGLVPFAGPSRIVSASHNRLLTDASLRAREKNMIATQPTSGGARAEPVKLSSLFGLSTYFQFSAVSLADGARVIFDKHGIHVEASEPVKTPSPFVSDGHMADAVAASCAFPPVLSPVRVYSEIHKTWLHLVDGGVVDNLALTHEALRCNLLFISNAGGQMSENDGRGAMLVPNVWLSSQIPRLVGVVTGYPQTQRLRALVADRAGSRQVIHWDMASAVALKNTQSVIRVDSRTAAELSRIRTRLGGMSDALCRQLINLGYANCDAMIEKHAKDIPGFAYSPPDAWPEKGYRLDRPPRTAKRYMLQIAPYLCGFALIAMFAFHFGASWLEVFALLAYGIPLIVLGAVWSAITNRPLVITLLLPALMFLVIFALNPLMVGVVLIASLIFLLIAYLIKQREVQF